MIVVVSGMMTSLEEVMVMTGEEVMVGTEKMVMVMTEGEVMDGTDMMIEKVLMTEIGMVSTFWAFSPPFLKQQLFRQHDIYFTFQCLIS